MRQLKLIITIVFCLFLSGCATPNVPLSANFWQVHRQKVVVASTQPIKPTMYKQGPQGLLDIAINDLVDCNFTNYISKTNLSWYGALPSSFVTQLNKHSMKASLFPNYVEVDKKNYPTLFAETNADDLLIIQLEAVGAVREYYGFIPLNAPQAYVVLTGQLISSETYQVLWRDQVVLSQTIPGAWDQPPDYPNYTEALNEVVSAAQEELMNNFLQNS